MSTREERSANALLASELGYEQGQPRYQWRYSENHHMPFRAFDANGQPAVTHCVTEGGLIDIQPKYELRKAASYLNRQWVVCKWMDPGSESQWREQFGQHIEYPRNGIYFPSNVYLEEGINPWDTDQDGVTVTHYIIRLIKEQAKKSLADLKAEGEAILANREKANDHRIDEILGDVMLPFGHEPGTRNSGVSLPSAASAANHDKVFGAVAPKEN